MMKTCEPVKRNKQGEFITRDGRIFKPLYGSMLEKMPKDIVRELANRRRRELDEINGKSPK